jgi:putative membrane protein
MADPRVLFAAERTLLAWVRTGITVIGGFVVARFGLSLTVQSSQLGTPAPPHPLQQTPLSSVLF